MQGKRKGAKSTAKASRATSQASSPKTKRGAQERLRPGQLDGLVLGYMKKQEGELPITAAKVASGIKRSSGAVANCLRRLEKAGDVKPTNKKPREYDLARSTK